MHITPAIIGFAITLLVLLNVAAVYRVHARHRRVRDALELPQRMTPSNAKVRTERAIEVFQDTDAKLRKRAPHLSTEERHEMARALMRAKNQLPPGSKLHASA